MANPFLESYISGQEQSRRQGLAAMQQRAQEVQMAGALQKMQQEQQMRAEVADAAGDPQRLEAISMKYGGPQAVLGHLDRQAKSKEMQVEGQARRDTQMQISQDRITAAKEAQKQRGEDQRNMMQMQLEGRKQMAQIAAGLKAPPDAGTVTDDTLRMDAYRYLTDGTLPTNMGRGMQGAKQATQIRNEASRIAKDELNMPVEDVRMAQLTNKGQVSAIMQLGKARAQILQFEKTAEYNLDLAVKASEKVDRTGTPVFNKWLQAGRTTLAGDPDTAVFNAANATFISEYARVMSGGYGAAQTTEGAQQRAHELLSTANTKEQYRAVTNQLKTEMNNRVRALNTQMEEEKGRLRSGVFGKPPAPAAPAAAAPTPKVVDFGSLK